MTTHPTQDAAREALERALADYGEKKAMKERTDREYDDSYARLKQAIAATGCPLSMYEPPYLLAHVILAKYRTEHRAKQVRP